ncbi:MAG: 1-(5-phosphoribosyl)-5-[(5-phosphoribosylamino)methylideneamino]imidazole-4-carboxamide isomerase [Legionellales bacterium]|jgi:phosphoribosylformimino-5-aminoimidazole carboxamide ribotide isomerase
MIIIPAIDLRNNKCVRLYQGDYAQETIYADNPLDIIKNFEQSGSLWVHIVDLDGAKDPAMHQRTLIEKICKNTTLNVQTGGGIRDANQVEELLNAGVKRVVIGSLAVKNPDLIKSWFKKWGADRFVLALDVNKSDDDYYIAIHGWQEKSTQKLFDFLKEFKAAGLIHALCTDISLDGTLKGPNVNLYQDILKHYPDLQLQASGGVASLDDIVLLNQNKLAACIIGRALYEGKIILDEAIGSVSHAC